MSFIKTSSHSKHSTVDEYRGHGVTWVTSNVGTENVYKNIKSERKGDIERYKSTHRYNDTHKEIHVTYVQ